MKKQSGTKKELLEKISALKQKIKELDLSDSERKQAEAALREGEQRLYSIIDGSPIPAFVIGKNHRVIHWNKALEKLSRIKSEEVIGTCEHWRAFYSEGRPCLADLLVDEAVVLIPQWYSGKDIKSSLIEGAYEATDFFSALGEDGKWLRFTAAAARDSKGMIVAAIETLEDITERKRAEEALGAEKEKFKTLSEEAPFGMVTIKPDGTFRYINSKAKELFGYDLSDVPDGKTWFRKAYPDPTYRHHVIEAWIKDLEKYKRGEKRPEVFTVTCKDGTEKIVNFLPVQLTTGENLMTCEDITERKRAEEEKRSLEERLNRAEKMEALGLLAGGVAHDLNNVLGIVVGYAELLLNDIDESNPMRANLLNIMDGGQKAAAIVLDLLTLARRGVSGRKVLNLNRVILDFIKSPEWEKLFSHHPSVRIRTDLEPDLLNISASPVHLGKTLYNLVSNAGEAMAKGGNLTIKTTNQYLDKPVQGYDNIHEGDYVVLSVSDEGEGISATDLKRIFEPFYTKKIMGRSGTGLGLSVVWGTVKDHHGYIDVQSEEGKGTVFTLYFSVTREDITAEASSVSMSEYMGKGESILVVDDVKGQRDLATAMLKKLNYKVASVSSGEDAVEYLREHKVDILVLDMIMEPGMDGLDTYKSVLEIHPKQRAIIVSGFSESDRVNAAHELGAGSYVKKPYVIEKLGMAVKNELTRK